MYPPVVYSFISIFYLFIFFIFLIYFNFFFFVCYLFILLFYYANNGFLMIKSISVRKVYVIY